MTLREFSARCDEAAGVPKEISYLRLRYKVELEHEQQLTRLTFNLLKFKAEDPQPATFKFVNKVKQATESLMKTLETERRELEQELKSLEARHDR